MGPRPGASRREFLASVIAAAAFAQRGADPLHAQTGPSRPAFIDVHHHLAPPAWVAEVSGRPLLNPASAKWTLAQSLDDMDRGGVAASVVSVTNPGLAFGDAAATRKLARACNDYAARLVQDHPARFGMYASLPMPDIDGSLAELAYAYDTLKTDGIALFTSYSDGWLGNPAYRPVMEELNRRRAVVHVHPTAAECCRNLSYAPGLLPSVIEYGTDTSRAIAGVVVSGDAARYPDIRFIWSHAGGSMPFLAGRFENGVRNMKDRLPDGVMPALRKFFYDVAGAFNRGAMASLLELVPPSQVLFGTDFPAAGAPSGNVAAAIASLGLLRPGDLDAVYRGNALKLFPRLRA
jgi:predicted TIM-barrel fold metal-dependent hydrolase